MATRMPPVTALTKRIRSSIPACAEAISADMLAVQSMATAMSIGFLKSSSRAAVKRTNPASSSCAMAFCTTATLGPMSAAASMRMVLRLRSSHERHFQPTRVSRAPVMAAIRGLRAPPSSRSRRAMTEASVSFPNSVSLRSLRPCASSAPISSTASNRSVPSLAFARMRAPRSTRSAGTSQPHRNMVRMTRGSSSLSARRGSGGAPTRAMARMALLRTRGSESSASALSRSRTPDSSVRSRRMVAIRRRIHVGCAASDLSANSLAARADGGSAGCCCGGADCVGSSGFDVCVGATAAMKHAATRVITAPFIS